MSAQLSRAVRRRFVATWPPALAELGRFASAHDQAAFVDQLRAVLMESPQAAYAVVKARLYGLSGGPDRHQLHDDLDAWLRRHYRKETP